MSTDQDIREWARNRGENLSGRGRIPKVLRDEYAAEHGEPADSLQFDDVEPADETEQAPDVSGDSTVTRARGLLKRTQQRQRTSSRSKRVKASKPRVAVDRLIERGWEMVARTVQPVNLPVARVLHMQAPIAGLILEDEIKDTLIDRALQPLARVEKRGETLFAMVGPPILVGLLTSKPELAPVVVPILKESLAVWIDIAGPKMEIQAQRAAEFQEKYGDQVDAIIAMILAPAPEEMAE